MRECRCDVCVVGNLVHSLLGMGAYDDWAHDGFNMEGDIVNNTATKLIQFRYWLHFIPLFAVIRYFKW